MFLFLFPERGNAAVILVIPALLHFWENPAQSKAAVITSDLKYAEP